MDAESASLIGYRLVPARDPRGVFEAPGAVWAEPDQRAAVALRRLADDPQARVALGRARPARGHRAARLGPLAEALRATGLARGDEGARLAMGTLGRGAARRGGAGREPAADPGNGGDPVPLDGGGNPARPSAPGCGLPVRTYNGLGGFLLRLLAAPFAVPRLARRSARSPRSGDLRDAGALGSPDGGGATPGAGSGRGDRA